MMPMLSATIASTNSAPTSQRRLGPTTASMNSAAMRAQTSSAEKAQKLIAQLVNLARWERLENSRMAFPRSVSSSLLQALSRARARSMIRASRFAITERSEPMPVSRKTGAMASWMTWAIVVMS